MGKAAINYWFYAPLSLALSKLCVKDCGALFLLPWAGARVLRSAEGQFDMTALMTVANALQSMGLLKGGEFEDAEDLLKVLCSKTASPEEKSSAKSRANLRLIYALYDSKMLSKRLPIGWMRNLLMAISDSSSKEEYRGLWYRLGYLCLQNEPHMDWYVECVKNIGQKLPNLSDEEIECLKEQAANPPPFPTKKDKLLDYIQQIRRWGADWRKLIMPLHYLEDPEEVEKTFWWSLERSTLEPDNGPLAFMQLLIGIKAGNESVPLYIP